MAQVLGKVCVQGHSGELWCFYFPNVGGILLNCMEECTDDGLLVFIRSIHMGWYTAFVLRSSGVSWDDPSAVHLHTLRHGVAEGLQEAAGGCSTALHGERACRTGADRQRVRQQDMQMSSSFPPSSSERSVSFRRPDELARIIGNIVLTNKKAHFVLTHKLLLLHYKYEVWK